MKDKTSVFNHFFLARSQTFYLRDHKLVLIPSTVRVMLIMLRKNTRNNVLIGGMRVCERDQRLNESIQRSAVTRKLEIIS